MVVGIVVLVVFQVIVVLSAIKIVPQQEAWVTEMWGKFDTIHQGGVFFLVPIVHRVAYKHKLTNQIMPHDISKSTGKAAPFSKEEKDQIIGFYFASKQEQQDK